VKILICSANYAPELTGVGKYSGDMAQWLVANGHQVRVVAAPPYYPAWQIAVNYRNRPFCREILAGVEVWRAPLWIPGRPGGLARVVHLISFAISSAPLLIWLGLIWRPNVCISVAPFFTSAPGVLIAAKLAGAPSWLHIQDFEVDVAFRMGLLKGGLLRRIALAIERTVFSRFERVSTISQRMMERVAAKGVRDGRQVLFRNWVDVEAICPLQGISPFRQELGLPIGAVVVLFAGTLGSKQGLHLIPLAAQLLRDNPAIHFVICGDGPEKPEIQRQATDLPQIHFLPLQPLARLGDLLGLADIHLLTQDVAAEDLVLPSKLSGMLSSGRPVVVTCAPDTEMAEVVREKGVVVPPNDAVALASALRDLAANAQTRQSLGLEARRYALDTLGRDQVLALWAGELERLVNEH
jgi:colanic acid biosynthesis glycosyl transferase WcaI